MRFEAKGESSKGCSFACVTQGHSRSSGVAQCKKQENGNFTLTFRCVSVLEANLQVLTHLKFLVFVVTLFWPELNKCPKIGSK